MKLRHYGATAYDASKFRPIKDRQWVKPHGGLWTSPIDSEYGWIHWCKENDFRECKIFFDITISGKVLVIDNDMDLLEMPWQTVHQYFNYPMFEPLLEQGIVAIHLTERGQWSTRNSEPYNLYGWDCESVLILDASCIQP